MREGFTQEFLEQFRKGVDLYVAGNWNLAWEELEQVEFVKGGVDYPTWNLLDFIEQENNEAPKDWKGYRIISE